MKILVINPGSTSTKIAGYENETCLWKRDINHPASDINAFSRVGDQYEYRSAMVLETLEENGTLLEEFDSIVGTRRYAPTLSRRNLHCRC